MEQYLQRVSTTLYVCSFAIIDSYTENSCQKQRMDCVKARRNSFLATKCLLLLFSNNLKHLRLDTCKRIYYLYLGQLHLEIILLHL